MTAMVVQQETLFPFLLLHLRHLHIPVIVLFHQFCELRFFDQVLFFGKGNWQFWTLNFCVSALC